jgi:hypothetical protein
MLHSTGDASCVTEPRAVSDRVPEFNPRLMFADRQTRLMHTPSCIRSLTARGSVTIHAVITRTELHQSTSIVCVWLERLLLL